ncbi:MAG: O-methyltransferase [Thermomicrobiales bacterium]|nr:O-methyltransferase [Thermomicrobiales bacterium]MCO5221732.1 O-methyltransferase [Thermomicrobiales bacterium]
MFPILDPRIDTYLRQLEAKHDDPVLLEMEALAERNHFPIVGRLSGVFLETMALAIGARTVFELGSGFGYSAWWFTRAVGADGTVYCTDGDPQNRTWAEDFLTRAGRWDRVNYRTGNAQDLLADTLGTFDIVYNDVLKPQYPETWLQAKDRVRPGGFYIADNVLWSGRVTPDGAKGDTRPNETEAIKRHNELVYADPDFDAFIHPVRDGLLVARKTEDGPI